MSWAPDYATSDELKSWVRVNDTIDDLEIATVLTAASRAVDRVTGRQFGQVAAPEARSYVARWNRHLPVSGWEVEIDDLATVTGFEIAVDGSALTEYDLGPSNALLKGMVYTRLFLDSASTGLSRGSENVVTVTGRWGWSAVPSTVKQAVLLQSARVLARRDAPFGVAGSPDQGSEVRLLARVDPDVELLLRPYNRKWWSA